MIDLTGKNKAEVLAKLYNAASVKGFGVLHASPHDMTVSEAQDILDSGETYFDYFRGRVLKVDLCGDSLDPRLYDRDNGHGAAAAAIAGHPRI